MTNPWIEIDVDGSGPYVLESDRDGLASAEKIIDRRGEAFRQEYGYRTQLYPDPFTGTPDAPVVVFTLNPGYTDEEKAERWRPKGCTGSDDWWHTKSDVMRECYRANLRHARLQYPLFFLDPRLRGSPGGVYYRQQFRSLIELYGDRRVAERVVVVEYFPYHSKSFNDIARVPSQGYAIHLIRSAIERKAKIVVLRAKAALQAAVPELRDYPIITANSKQNATISAKNITRFAELCDGIR
jgi:hypothetical protein